MDARRRRDPQAVHVQGFPRSNYIRELHRPEGRGGRSSPRHSDQLQTRDVDLFDAQRRRADREGLRRRSDGRPMRLKRTYSSREVAALTGLSAKQLQLWDAGGLLSPAIPSHKTAAGGYTERRYTPIELFELLVLADLRQPALSVHHPHPTPPTLADQSHPPLFQ